MSSNLRRRTASLESERRSSREGRHDLLEVFVGGAWD
jgi:hypothetical protein